MRCSFGSIVVWSSGKYEISNRYVDVVFAEAACFQQLHDAVDGQKPFNKKVNVFIHLKWIFDPFFNKKLYFFTKPSNQPVILADNCLVTGILAAIPATTCSGITSSITIERSRVSRLLLIVTWDRKGLLIITSKSTRYNSEPDRSWISYNRVDLIKRCGPFMWFSRRIKSEYINLTLNFNVSLTSCAMSDVWLECRWKARSRSSSLKPVCLADRASAVSELNLIQFFKKVKGIQRDYTRNEQYTQTQTTDGMGLMELQNHKYITF